MAMRVRTRRPRRYLRKRLYRRRRYVRPMGATRIKRTCALAAQITGGTASDNVIWNQSNRAQGYFNFSLSDLPNNGEITALYSLYKLTGVALKFVPIVGTDAPTGSTSFMDSFCYCIDKSVRGVPASLDEVLEQGNCKIMNASARAFKVYIPFPKAASTINSQSALMSTPWLDTDANNIKHYGLRYSFGNSLASATVRYQVYATYYLRVKTLK